MNKALCRRFVEHITEHVICKDLQQKRILSVLLIVVLIAGLTACGGKGSNDDPDAPPRDNTPVVLETEASDKKEFSADGCKVDYSNTKKGYLMAKYTGSNSKVKLQLKAHGETYNYDLPTKGNWEAFPLSSGSGEYSVGIYENISGEEYRPVLQESFNADLKNEYQPYLHPNQYVDYTKKTKAVALSEEVCEGATSDLGAVERIYNYTIDAISYDYDKAKNVQPGYLPDIDETLQTGKGICFDYASVMAAMLRAQKIPCKLVIGYAGSAYHAWISVYTKETGWVDDIIEFDGVKWRYMDPTFASSGDNSDPNVVGDGENYNPQYFY